VVLAPAPRRCLAEITHGGGQGLELGPHLDGGQAQAGLHRVARQHHGAGGIQAGDVAAVDVLGPCRRRLDQGQHLGGMLQRPLAAGAQDARIAFARFDAGLLAHRVHGTWTGAQDSRFSCHPFRPWTTPPAIPRPASKPAPVSSPNWLPACTPTAPPPSAWRRRWRRYPPGWAWTARSGPIPPA